MKNLRAVLNEVDPRVLTPGDVIRAARNNFNITQDQVCEITGLKKSNLSNLENNKIDFTVHYAEILGAALGLHPSAILFPNGHYGKSKKIKEIEKKAQVLLHKVRSSR